jgi:hypothetical protein
MVFESLAAIPLVGALKSAAVGVGAAIPTLVSNGTAATQHLVTAATPVVTKGAILAGKGLVAAGHAAEQGLVTAGALAVKGAAAAQNGFSHLAHAVGAATATGAATAGAAKGTLGTVLAHSAQGATNAAQSVAGAVLHTVA